MHGECAECEHITEVWEWSPQRGPGRHSPSLKTLHQSQERPLAKVGWSVDMSTQSTRGDSPGHETAGM